ncbi:hypothetical protein HYC85_019321 [Camellia sinensis]|uniref:Germin-like protein n=1 Tax=Camellia sinensis TaxID=4442 RepID=A0A7J7GLI4_CAMSI|nr:hypothetical protein HYC85_019321 [Camellia sinensis]
MENVWFLMKNPRELGILGKHGNLYGFLPLLLFEIVVIVKGYLKHEHKINDNKIKISIMFSLIYLRKMFVNGKVCKDPKLAITDDFFFSGLLTPQSTSNQVGTLCVGFVTSNTNNLLFTKILFPRNVFVFPQGLIHFQFNNGTANVVALAALNNQNPRIITVANAVFRSNPKIFDDVLAKAFQVDKKVVDYLQAQIWWPNN